MRLLILALLMIVTIESRAEDMLDYMNVTDDLIETGEYREALERTIWFHNHAIAHDNSMAPVRLSFSLLDWYNFGKKYPPALNALIKIRNDKTKKIVGGVESFDLFNDVSAINKVLSEDDRTLSLFKKLEKLQPSSAKRYWPIVQDIAVKNNDYALLKKYSINVLSEYKTAEELLMFKLEQFRDNESFTKMSKNTFVEKTLELIDLASTLNDKETALLIRDKAEKLIDDPRFNALTTNNE